MNAFLRRFLGLLTFLFILAGGDAYAANVVVDCTGATPGAFTSINAAIATLDDQGPNSVTVTGPCVENVGIFNKERLTIQASGSEFILTPSNPNARVLRIFHSHTIVLVGLASLGGRGVVVDESRDVELYNSRVEGSAIAGLVFNDDSTGYINNGGFRNNAGAGIAVTGGALTLDDSVIVESNGRNGLAGTNNARILVSGGSGGPGTENYFRNNRFAGAVAAQNTSMNITGDNRFLNNGFNGISAVHDAYLGVDSALVQGNGTSGIHVGETSHGEILGGVVVQNNGSPANAGATSGIEVVENSDLYLDSGITVTGNQGPGVLVDLSSLFSSLGGNFITNNTEDGIRVHGLAVAHLIAPDTVTGNGNSNLTCDTTSLVTGDPTGLTNVKCMRIERTNGKPRPGHIPLN